MTPRIVATPIPQPPSVPVERAAGLDPALLDAVAPVGGIEAQLERLRDPRALVVTTGQQPGLFTGPLYTVHKALSAAALARILEQRWQRPVVPVFWAAGDDHDFAEASRTAWLGQDGGLVEAALEPRATEAPLTPMYRQPLGESVQAALAKLEAELCPGEYRAATLEWIRRHYRADATVAGAFLGAIAELLAPAGVVCLDSTHPAVKRLAAPWMIAALEAAGDLDRLLAEQSEVLAAGGTDPGVAPADGATLVMLEGRAGRDRLVAQGDGFVTRRGRERFTLAELRDIARRDPERLSPNVLLRPVIESALLPTVAYLAGPGELRYLTLTPPVFDRLGVPRQEPMARWSGVLVEPRVDRVLDKFGITLEELLEPGSALESRLVRSKLPDEALAALDRLRSAIEREYDAVLRSATAIDPTLERPVLGTKRQALAGAQDTEKKLVQHLKRRQETELGQLAKARAAVLPHGKPQERVLSAVSFLPRAGFELVPALAAAIHDWFARALEGAEIQA